MNAKFWISLVVVFILSMGLDFVIHGALLDADYKALAHLYRTVEDQQAHMPYMLLAHVLMSGALVWIYKQGKTAMPFLQQGLRFGAAISFLAVIPGYLIYFSVQPLPAMMVHKQMIFSTIAMLIIGVVLAWLNRK